MNLLELSSEIRHVMVFRQGAVVTRSVVVGTKSECPQVSLVGLPKLLDDASIRVRLQCKENNTTQPVDLRVELVLPPAGESIRDVDSERLLLAVRLVNNLQEQRDRVEAELGLFASLSPSLTNPADGERPLAAATTAWRELLAWQRGESEKRHAEIAQLDTEIKVATEARQRLEQAITAARAERDYRADRVSKRVLFSVDGTLEAGTEIFLEYRVPGARWAPSYVVRVARDGKTAELSLRAMIAQNTGEMWRSVKLSLSTATFLRGQDLPELKSLRIGRQLQSSAKTAWRDPPGDTDRLFAALDAAMGRDPSPPTSYATMSPLVVNEPQRQQKPRPEARPKPSPPPAPPQPPMFGGGGPPVGAAMPPGAPASAPPSAPMMSGAVMSSAPMRDMVPQSKSAAPLAKKSRGFLARNEAPQDEDSFLSADEAPIPEEEGALPEPSPQEASVVLALKELRYSELKIVAYAGTARGKLQPLELADRVDESDRQLSARMMASMGAAMQAAQAADILTIGTPVETTTGFYDYRYDSDAAVDVPSDGAIHNIALLKRGAEIKNVYVAVPRESQDVVRIATLMNPLEAPLLMGDAEIYLEDEYLVSTQVRTVPTRGALTIGLGVEPAIKIARKVRFEEESEGLLRGSRALDHAIEIEVASRLRQPVDIEVRERVPILQSGEKEIAIEVKNVSPEWEKFEQADRQYIRGGQRWRFSLEPGASKTVSFSYRVKIDSKAELVGGNRREPY